MTLALRPQLKRSFCSQKWLFTLLLSLLIALTSHLPIAAVKIAFQSSRDFGEFAFKYNIYVMDANGKNLVRLTQGPASDVNPAWSPDGTQIAFASNRDGDFEIYVMNTDGANPVQLTEDPWATDWTPTWSPDGKRIAFSSDRDGDDEIYVMNPDGTDPIQLTHNLWEIDFSPVWSSDGKKIAFSSYNHVRNADVYVMNADGSDLVNLTQNQSADDFLASWLPTPLPVSSREKLGILWRRIKQNKVK